MRLLFSAKHPPTGGVAFGGVASWISTLVKQLETRGHECAVWGPSLPEPKGRFDVGVLSNINATGRAAAWCDKFLCVSHGVVADEKPDSWRSVIYTSEEVAEHWTLPGVVLRQPIDLDYWRDDGRERQGFVFYSYRAPDVFGLDHLARRLGMRFSWVKGVETSDAREILQSAALVAASGRAALEAMAAGAPTLICDHRPYNGGPLIEVSTEKAMRFNYSGRTGVHPDAINMESIARQTMAFQKPREHVVAHHNAAMIAAELLKLC